MGRLQLHNLGQFLSNDDEKCSLEDLEKLKESVNDEKLNN